jgi:CheY-like chemotaxis protein
MSAGVIEELQPARIAQKIRHSILVVDDDNGQIEVLNYRLKNQGYDTLTATSGNKGLEIARQHLPQLVLLDLRLPDIDGFQICQQLSDDPQTCGIPVIIISGMERPDIIRRARAAGCRYYVRKPYDPNVLLILIQSVLGQADRCC